RGGGWAARPHDIFLRVVMNALGRIEPKTVEMKFLDPVPSIGNEELADWSAILPIEIDRIAPFVFALAIDVIVGVNTEIISVGSEVIVNNIENDPESERVGTVDKCPQIVRCSIKMG